MILHSKITITTEDDAWVRWEHASESFTEAIVRLRVLANDMEQMIPGPERRDGELVRLLERSRIPCR